MMARASTIFLLLWLTASFSRSYLENARKNTLLVLAYDGFRWDYVKYTKHLLNLAREGVTAINGMQSSFITTTTPNFFTLATGLYPKSHGLIANYFYDPVFREVFYTGFRDPKWYKDLEPIWITNEKSSNATTGWSNFTRKSAVIQWVGSEIAYEGRMPSYYDKFHMPKMSNSVRFRKVLRYLQQKDPPNLILCYFEEPDHVGHHHGPDSWELRGNVSQLDQGLGVFLKELKENNLYDELNIVVVSDHGMTKASSKNVIYLEKILDAKSYQVTHLGASAFIWPTKKRYTKYIYEKLKSVAHLTVYPEKGIPERLQFRGNRRTPPILALADPGWNIVQSSIMEPFINLGAHGYDNKVKDMNGLFIARGPAFKKGAKIDTFSNIHIYELLCHLIGIDARPNNGSLDVFVNALESSPKNSRHPDFAAGIHTKSTSAVVIAILVSVSVILIAINASFCLFIIKRTKINKEGYARVQIYDIGNMSTDFSVNERMR